MKLIIKQCNAINKILGIQTAYKQIICGVENMKEYGTIIRMF